MVCWGCHTSLRTPSSFLPPQSLFSALLIFQTFCAMGPGQRGKGPGKGLSALLPWLSAVRTLEESIKKTKDKKQKKNRRKSDVEFYVPRELPC